MKYFLAILISASLVYACAEPKKEPVKEEINIDERAEKKAILDVLELQRSAWNDHDLEKFMAHYWESDSMRFMTKSGIRYGWQTTLDNYKESYPTAEKMGELQFTVKHLDLLSAKSAYILGQWELNVDTTNYGGHFSLIWKKVNGKWVIVTDHTS